MISIAEAISDLLYVRDTVVVPGLGAFVKKPVSARVNPVANYFAMPSSIVEFDANLREDNDWVVNYMSEKNDIPVEEARRLLAMFVSDCFNSLKAGKKVILNQIGTLYNDWAGDPAFEPDKSVNYNADAFGLCDFSTEPVLRSKTKDEIKEEIERQQKDKNTPVTVDEKEVHRKDDDDVDESRHLGWMWIVLGLLLVAGTAYGLHYFKVVDFGKLIPAKPKRVIDIKPGTYSLPTYSVDWDEMLNHYKATWKPSESKEMKQEEHVETEVKQATPSNAVVADNPTIAPAEANIRIIAGCFGQEENAARLTNTLKEKGYVGAFYELSGSKWFVSFGRYATDEEATAALREIRANTEYKAWIKK